MHRSSIIDILKTFSKEELKDFEGFISSPYLNKNTIAVKLFKEVRKHAPDFTSDALAKEKLWVKIYPGKAYNYGIMKNLIFGLQKLGEDYVSYTYWKKSEYYDKSLISGLQERNAEALFIKKATGFNNMLDKRPAKDQFFYIEKLFVKSLIDSHNMNRIMQNKSRLETQELLEQSFMMHYLVNCFHFAVEMHRTNVTHDFRFLQYLLDYFKNNDEFFHGAPLLKIYYLLMLSLMDIMDDDNFMEAKNLFTSIYSTLPRYEIKNIYNILILLCLFKESKRKDEYRKIRLGINIEIAGNKVLSNRDGLIELEAFRNIVILALNAREYEIVKDFINENKHKVISRSPETIILYSDATLSFAEGKFEECLKICSKINFKDFWELNTVNYFFKCDVRLLEIKSHYELNNIEAVITSIDSFKRFVANSTEINEMNKSTMRLFLKFLHRLLMIKINFDKSHLAELKIQLNTPENVTSRYWLLDRIETLEKSH